MKKGKPQLFALIDQATTAEHIAPPPWPLVGEPAKENQTCAHALKEFSRLSHHGAALPWPSQGLPPLV